MAGQDADSTVDAPDVADSAGLDPADEGRPRWPPFLRHGLFAVGVFVVAVSAVLALSEGDLQGPALVAFSVGFSVFMLFYFIAMYIAWVFME